MTEGFIQNVQFDLFEGFIQNVQFDLFEGFIQNVQFDLFSVELVIGDTDTATLLLAENYVTIREVFVNNIKVEPNESKQIFLTGDLWELGIGDILLPKDGRTFTIKKAHEVNTETGSADKYLNEQGDMTQVEAGQVKYTPSAFVGSENVQDAITELGNNKQETLVSGTNIKTINGESILGGGNIEIQGSVSSYYAETVPAPANAGILMLKNATETVISTTLTNSNSFAIALPTAVAGKVSESILIFKVGATLPTLTQPSGVIYRTAIPTIAINQTWTFCYEKVSYDNGLTFETYVSATKNV